MRAGRARVPCSFVAQPPPCAPLWLVDRSVGIPSPRGCRARTLPPLVALLLRAVAPCASLLLSLAVVEVVGVGFFGRLRSPAARCPASLLPLWPSLCGLPPFSFVLLRCIRRPHRAPLTSSPPSPWLQFRPFGAVALVGLLRRERPARRGARPLQGLSLRSAHRCRSAGFFRLARCFACPGAGGFPSRASLRGLPPCPRARSPAGGCHFLIRRGAPRPADCRARGLRPCARRGGRAARPPAPRGAPTRGAVFFMVFCFLRICNFRGSSGRSPLKNHKYY